MTLHEAIAVVLEGGRRMSSAEIACAIDHRGLYTRGDGRPLPPSQVSARVANHPELFARDELSIRLVASPSPRSSSGELARGSRPERRIETPMNMVQPEFAELGCIGELLKRGLPPHDWLEDCGVYTLRIPAGFTPSFIPAEKASAAGNVVRAWSIDRLQAKWVSGTDVIYIGVAGRYNARSLRSRLEELLKHAAGKTSSNGPHCGGEIVWQLRDHTRLLLSAAQCHRALKTGHR